MLRLIRFLLLEIYLFFFSLAGTRARNSLYLLSLRFALAIFQSIRSLNYLVRFVFFFLLSFFFLYVHFCRILPLRSGEFFPDTR